MVNTLKTTLLLGLLTGLIIAVGGAVGGRGGAILALIVAAGMNFFSYWFSDRIVLAMSRARPVSREEAPRLHAILERLCGKSGLPVPRPYLIPEAAPNAFATGRNPSNAAVAVTQGLLQVLGDEELEGVVAHELAHVKNHDILISSLAATLAGAVMVLANMAQWAAIFGGFGGRRGDSRDGGLLGLLVTILVAPIAATLIQLAVSRAREYQADATAARMVGHPYGLARALEKLDQLARRVPMHSAAGPATSHLFIVRPLSGASLGNLFSTHPPVAERVRRLLGR
jgi:heat shock protein HtpX